MRKVLLISLFVIFAVSCGMENSVNEMSKNFKFAQLMGKTIKQQQQTPKIGDFYLEGTHQTTYSSSINSSDASIKNSTGERPSVYRIVIQKAQSLTRIDRERHLSWKKTEGKIENQYISVFDSEEPSLSLDIFMETKKIDIRYIKGMNDYMIQGFTSMFDMNTTLKNELARLHSMQSFRIHDASDTIQVSGQSDKDNFGEMVIENGVPLLLKKWNYQCMFKTPRTFSGTHYFNECSDYHINDDFGITMPCSFTSATENISSTTFSNDNSKHEYKITVLRKNTKNKEELLDFLKKGEFFIGTIWNQSHPEFNYEKFRKDCWQNKSSLLCKITDELIAKHIIKYGTQETWQDSFNRSFTISSNENIKYITGPVYGKIEFTDNLRSKYKNSSNESIMYVTGPVHKKTEFIDNLRSKDKGFWPSLLLFGVDKEMYQLGFTVNPTALDLSRMLRYFLNYAEYEIREPSERKKIIFHGDFIIRTGASRDVLLTELERIVKENVNSAFQFKKLEEEQTVFIAKGKPELLLKKIEEKKSETSVPLGISIGNNEQAELGNCNSGTIGSFLNEMQDDFSVKIINETLSSDVCFSWNVFYPVKFTKTGIVLKKTRMCETVQAEDGEMQKILGEYLAEITKQSGITFQQEKRKVQVITW